jgi:hypothetical protein
MWNKLKLALLISAPLAGATAFALADNAPAKDPAVQKKVEITDPKLGKTGPKLDNGDAKLDAKLDDAKRDERHKAMLARFDANKDGKLDDAERATMRDALATERFRALDKNGDGALSLEEFKAGAAQHRHGRNGHRKHHGTSMKP